MRGAYLIITVCVNGIPSHWKVVWNDVENWNSFGNCSMYLCMLYPLLSYHSPEKLLTRNVYPNNDCRILWDSNRILLVEGCCRVSLYCHSWLLMTQTNRSILLVDTITFCQKLYNQGRQGTSVCLILSNCFLLKFLYLEKDRKCLFHLCEKKLTHLLFSPKSVLVPFNVEETITPNKT